jgi:hypothetical protein
LQSSQSLSRSVCSLAVSASRPPSAPARATTVKHPFLFCALCLLLVFWHPSIFLISNEGIHRERAHTTLDSFLHSNKSTKKAPFARRNASTADDAIYSYIFYSFGRLFDVCVEFSKIRHKSYRKKACTTISE